MTNVTERKLPHAVSYADIKDQQLRTKIMMLVENVVSLKTQLAEAQKAIVELQRR